MNIARTMSMHLGRALFLLLFSVLAYAQPPASLTQLEFSSPTRLTFVTRNRLAVSDYRQKTISLLDANTMQKLEAIGVDGRPVGVAGGKEVLFVGNETRGGG